MIRLGVANIARARLTIGIAAAVTLVLGIASLGIAGRLAQSTFLVPGTPYERAWSNLNKHFGQGTSFAVLLEGRPAELRRQGLALTEFLARQPNYSVISPWTGSKAANLRPNPNSAVVVVTLNTPVRDKYREKPVDIAERMQRLVDQHIRPGVRASITGPATVGLGLRNAALS